VSGVLWNLCASRILIYTLKLYLRGRRKRREGRNGGKKRKRGGGGKRVFRGRVGDRAQNSKVVCARWMISVHAWFVLRRQTIQFYFLVDCNKEKEKKKKKRREKRKKKRGRKKERDSSSRKGQGSPHPVFVSGGNHTTATCMVLRAPNLCEPLLHHPHGENKRKGGRKKEKRKKGGHRQERQNGPTFH